MLNLNDNNFLLIFLSISFYQNINRNKKILIVIEIETPQPGPCRGLSTLYFLEGPARPPFLFKKKIWGKKGRGRKRSLASPYGLARGPKKVKKMNIQCSFEIYLIGPEPIR